MAVRIESTRSSPLQMKRKVFQPEIDTPPLSPASPLSLFHPLHMPPSPNSSGKFSRGSNSPPRAGPRVSPQKRFGITFSKLQSLASFSKDHVLEAESPREDKSEKESDAVSSVRMSMRSTVLQDTIVYQDILSNERKNKTKLISTLLESLSQFTSSPNKVQLGDQIVTIPEATAFSPSNMFNTEFGKNDEEPLAPPEIAKKLLKIEDIQKLVASRKTPVRRQESLLKIADNLLFRRTVSDDPRYASERSSSANSYVRPRIMSPSTWGTSSRWKSVTPASNPAKIQSLGQTQASAKPAWDSSSRPRAASPSPMPASAKSNRLAQAATVSKIGSSFDRLFVKSIRPPKTVPASAPPSAPPSLHGSPRIVRQSSLPGGNSSNSSLIYPRRASNNSSMKSM